MSFLSKNQGSIGMNEAREKRRQGVIFFFGAGASVDAGVPNTCQFLEDFKSNIEREDLELYEQLDKIVEIREKFNESHSSIREKQVDVEQLLDMLRRLEDKDQEVLLDFYEGKVFNADIKEENFSRLKRRLENYIRERVIVEEGKRLEYLKELLNFPFPLEIYSVNYDTCIEQISHLSHLHYTDGFDTYWSKKNFDDDDFNVKHYKLHGSIIWFENRETKEIVKIPVHAFIEKKQVELRLIYGEHVEPLLIYPAQKPEYKEPLTDLQLMFKDRLFKKETKILIIVGYSFRDDYIVRILWDAGRINDDLRIILVDPNAHSLFEDKLHFIDKDIKAESRIYDRVVCLPYPFSSVINHLRNFFLPKMDDIANTERAFIEQEKNSFAEPPHWVHLLKLCIDCGFLTKCESVIKKMNKRWIDIPFDSDPDRALFSVKAMLHSVIAKDEFEEEWLNRVNGSIKFLSIENLAVSTLDNKGFSLGFNWGPDSSMSFVTMLKDLINPILKERDEQIELLSIEFKNKLLRTEKTFKRLERLREYLASLMGGVNWEKYSSLRDEFKNSKPALTINQTDELTRLIVTIESKNLEKIFEGKEFRFEYD